MKNLYCKSNHLSFPGNFFLSFCIPFVSVAYAGGLEEGGNPLETKKRKEKRENNKGKRKKQRKKKEEEIRKKKEKRRKERERRGKRRGKREYNSRKPLKSRKIL